MQITGRGGVPASGVSAVVVNITVTSPTKPGYIIASPDTASPDTASPDGANRPTASNLNFVAGQTIPNLVVVPVGADGKIRLFNGGGGTVQLIAEIWSGVRRSCDHNRPTLLQRHQPNNSPRRIPTRWAPRGNHGPA